MEPGPSMLLVPFYHDTSRLRPGHMWEDSVTSCLWPGCHNLEPKQRCTLSEWASSVEDGAENN